MFQSILDDKKFLNSIVLQNEKSKLYYRKRSKVERMLKTAVILTLKQTFNWR